ncbi:MAG: hypothetical protein M3Q79_02570 [bacterium]|nr:hypothetical protein [bacterium]
MTNPFLSEAEQRVLWENGSKVLRHVVGKKYLAVIRDRVTEPDISIDAENPLILAGEHPMIVATGCLTDKVERKDKLRYSLAMISADKLCKISGTIVPVYELPRNNSTISLLEPFGSLDPKEVGTLFDELYVSQLKAGMLF